MRTVRLLRDILVTARMLPSTQICSSPTRYGASNETTKEEARRICVLQSLRRVLGRQPRTERLSRHGDYSPHLGSERGRVAGVPQEASPWSKGSSTSSCFREGRLVSKRTRILQRTTQYSRDVDAIASGRIGNRVKNRVVGRAPAKAGFWRKLWGRW